MLLDRRSVVVHRNAAAMRDFPGLVRGQLVNFSLRNPALLNAVETARRTDAAQSIELHQTVPIETWHRLHVAPLPGDEGLLVLTLHSLTDQKRLDQLRSDFIANASHELRTPLTSLMGFIDTLLGPAANDEAARVRFLNIMRQQAAPHVEADRRSAVAEPHRDAPAHAPDRHGRSAQCCSPRCATGSRRRLEAAGITIEIDRRRRRRR